MMIMCLAEQTILYMNFYNTYRPKISLALPMSDHSIAFDYGYTIHEYEGFSSRVAEQNRVNETLEVNKPQFP